MQPIQIYLDSSDFSNLSLSMENQSHPLRGIFDRLCSWVDDGAIEVRYSSAHVIEIAHVDPQSKQFARARARCLRRLTRGRCFRFWSELVEIECANLLQRRPVEMGTIDNSDHWYPDTTEFVRTIRKTLVEQLEKSLAEQPFNREQRRKFKRGLLKNGYLTRWGAELMRQDRGAVLNSMAELFPLSERFFEDDLMLKFCTGEVGAKEIVEEISIVFSDVEKFVEWTCDRDEERKVVTWLRTYGAELARGTQKLRAQFSNFTSKYHLQKQQREKILSALDEKIPELRKSRIAEVLKGLKNASSDGSSLDKLSSLPTGSIPTLDAYLLCLSTYLRRNSQTKRLLLDSDGGDIFHLTHLPYCDIFRADGETAQIAEGCANLFGKEVVSRLQQLPDRIDKVLRDRTV